MYKNIWKFFVHKNIHIFSEQKAKMSAKNERERTKKKISARQVWTYTDLAWNNSVSTTLMLEYTATSQFILAHTDLSWNTVNPEKPADL